MMWIKYQYVCNILNEGTENEEVILLDKKIGYNEKNLAIAETEAYNGKYEIIEDDEVIETGLLKVELGGTGADNAETARANLGAEASGTATKFLNRTSQVNHADTNHTRLMARGISLHDTETNPTVEGAICLHYE